jgi:hypothetical protein
MLYEEKEDVGNKYREKLYDELLDLIENRRSLAREKRKEFFNYDSTNENLYIKSISPLREKFKSMLGWPLTEESGFGSKEEANYEFVAEDDLGSIYRVQIPVLKGLTAYGIYFKPHGEGRFPLVISQHGGLGTPEACSGFFGSGNYHDMTRRVLKRGVAVFAHQMLLWNQDRFGPKFDRISIDNKLKQLGSSITAVEIFKLQMSINKLLERPELDPERVGMIGLSYGGFYTLFTAAVEERIKVAVSSCFVNDRFKVDWHDWTWFNAGNTFLDADICGLVCPRPLYIEAGDKDELFDVNGFKETAEEASHFYSKLGINDRFASVVFNGIHELNPEDEPIDFLLKWL